MRALKEILSYRIRHAELTRVIGVQLEHFVAELESLLELALVVEFLEGEGIVTYYHFVELESLLLGESCDCLVGVCHL